VTKGEILASKVGNKHQKRVKAVVSFMMGGIFKRVLGTKLNLSFKLSYFWYHHFYKQSNRKPNS